MNNLADKVREALSDRNARAVAKACGLSPHTVYRLINREYLTKPENVEKLANYLGVK